MYNYNTQGVYSEYDLNNHYRIVINTCTNLSDGLYNIDTDSLSDLNQLYKIYLKLLVVFLYAL